MFEVHGFRKYATIPVEERNQWLGRYEVAYRRVVICIGCKELLPVAGNSKTAGFTHKVDCAFRGFA